MWKYNWYENEMTFLLLITSPIYLQRKLLFDGSKTHFWRHRIIVRWGLLFRKRRYTLYGVVLIRLTIVYLTFPQTRRTRYSRERERKRVPWCVSRNWEEKVFTNELFKKVWTLKYYATLVSQRNQAYWNVIKVSKAKEPAEL